jgi:hypothetical protein
VFLFFISAQPVGPTERYLCIFLGVAALLVMSILAFSQEIFELDTRLGKYRLSYTLLGIAHGAWESLPDIKAVVIKHFSQFNKTGRHVPSSNKLKEYYIVMLSAESRATGIVVHKFALYQQPEAKRLAEQLAAYFQVPQLIFDKS